MRIQISQYELNIRPWLLPVVAAVLYTLVSLGNWQVSRAEYKEEYLKEFNEKSSQLLPLAQLIAMDNSPHGYKTTVTGSFDNKHNFLLDNQLNQKVAGYHVLTPFTTNDGISLLVNRGWIFRGRDRAILPEIPLIEGEQSFTGIVYIPSHKQLVLSGEQENTGNQWPKRVQKVDFDYMSGLIGVQLAPLTVRVEPGVPVETGEQFVRDWIQVSVAPEKHLAYALQWYGMAAIFTILFIRLALKRHRPEDPGTDGTNSED